MSSFLSNLASGTSTREVVEELERTKKRLEKSQARLTKLSGAYKALQEEKKTLEATISAISGPTEQNEGITRFYDLFGLAAKKFS